MCIKELFKSKRLRLAEARIKDLEIQNLQLLEKIEQLENAFLQPVIPEDADRTLTNDVNVSRLDY